jgi:hypothetical protein
MSCEPTHVANVRVLEIDNCEIFLELDWFQDYSIRPSSFIIRNVEPDTLDHWDQAIRLHGELPLTSLHMDMHDLLDYYMLEGLQHAVWVETFHITIGKDYDLFFDYLLYAMGVLKVVCDIQQATVQGAHRWQICATKATLVKKLLY